MKKIKIGIISLTLSLILGIIPVPLANATTLRPPNNINSNTTVENIAQPTESTITEDFKQIHEREVATENTKPLHLENRTDTYGWEHTKEMHSLVEQPQISSRASSQPKTLQYLAILIEFPDMTDVDIDDEKTLKAIDMVLNSGGTNIRNQRETPVVSLKEYMNKFSYGFYQINGSVFPKNNAGQVVSHTASHSYNYYLKETHSNPDGYDPNIDDSNNPKSLTYRENELIEETLRAAAASIENLYSGDQLDINEDGYIDSVVFFVESRGTENDTSIIDWDDLLWSHQITSTMKTMIAGKKIGSYNLINTYDPNQPNSLFAHNGSKTTNLNQLKLNYARYATVHHEFMHTLNLPDLYRGYNNGVPVGFYDIMSTDDHYYPAGMLSILSRDHLKWGGTIPQLNVSDTITINRPKYQDSNEVTSYKIVSPMNSQEYFMVEFYEKGKYPLSTELNGRADGFIVYRINSKYHTNINGSDDGQRDYIFVLRPGEFLLGSGLSPLKDAVVLPTVGNTFGKTLTEVNYDSEWNNTTLYYSNGKNSGIKLEVTGSTADTITLKVTVPSISATSIQVDTENVQLDIGSFAFVNASLWPANHGDTATYQWSSNNQNIVTVNANTGQMTGVAAGNTQATVTATLQNGKTLTRTINVNVKPATDHTACRKHILMMVNGVSACVHPSNFSLHVCTNNFPDAEFYAYIYNRSGRDGYLTMNELQSIYNISVASRNITYLQGIEYFAELTDLNCSKNQLAELDISHNTALTTLDCQSNQLTTLHLTKNTALTTLNCNSNQLKTLDVSKNTNLAHLNCYSNQLTTLDVSKNTNLLHLNCSDNQLTTLDVSKHGRLLYLYCYSNQLKKLDVTQNTDLTRLYCYDNQLDKLDITMNTKLTELDCESNQLKELNVSQNTNLTRLYCDENKLTELDISRNTSLTILYCYSNQLTILDVSKNTALRRLECYDNQLATLNLTNHQWLNRVNLSNQNLTLPAKYQNDKWIIDLSESIPRDTLGRISISDPTYRYDSGTGIVQFNGSGHPVSFSYQYDTGKTDTTMTVQVNINAPPYAEGTGNLGTNASFNGETVSLSRALYTFTASNNGSYSVSGQTTTGETVYLQLRPGKPGYPQTIGGPVSITLEENNDGSFYIKSTSSYYTGYLYFWRDNKNYFDQQYRTDNDCKFLIYRRGTNSETTSFEVPGYVKVKNKQEIISGNQYLIVAKVKDGYYALYPSNSINNKYSHVIKINSKNISDGMGNLGSDAGFTEQMVSLRNALYTFTANNGGYTVTAHTTSGETVNLCLRGGNAGYPQTTGNPGIISLIENNDGSFYIKSSSPGYTGYLYFWRENNKLYFDQSVELGYTYNKRFYLYRLAEIGETPSNEVPGYVQVTKSNAVISGGQYLIVAEAEGACYALYPSSTTNNRYSSVIRVNSVGLENGTGNLGNNISFTGQTVSLSNSLYTFTSNSSGYTVSAQTNSGQTVSLCLRPGKAGYPQTTDSRGIITLTQNNDGTFYIKSSSREYNGYLYFWQDASKLYFDQTLTNNSEDYNNKFLLFRPAIEGEKSSTEIPGYVWVNNANAITNGGQYLIVTEAHNTYYALHPSNDTNNNKYSHVIKINPPLLLPSGTCNLGTDNKFNGPIVSLKNALYDFTNSDNKCTISSKISSGEKVTLCLRPGKASYPQTTNSTCNTRLYATTQNHSFMINTFTDQYDGFLYFYHDSNKLYFDQTTQYDQNDVNQNFFLYRPAAANEKSSTEVPGYVRVTSYQTIGSGKQYLITTEVNGNYYGLYPSNSSNNPYAHVMKINSDQTDSFANQLNNLGMDDVFTYIFYFIYLWQINNGQ